MKQWLQDLWFIVIFRMKKKVERIKKRKRLTLEGEVMNTHRVRVIDHKGRFLLLECVKCGDRELAVDKFEAVGIYSRMDCVLRKEDDSHGEEEGRKEGMLSL